MKRDSKTAIGRRDVLRVLGAGAGAAVTAAAPLATPAQADSETADEKRKARYQPQFRRGPDILPGQPVPELREA